MTSYRYVRTTAALDEVTAALGAEAVVAVDTEAASFHKYRDRIYLVQLSGRTSTAIVDPLALDSLAPLGALLAIRPSRRSFTTLTTTSGSSIAITGSGPRISSIRGSPPS